MTGCAPAGALNVMYAMKAAANVLNMNRTLSLKEIGGEYRRNGQRTNEAQQAD